mgnify:CR=1 FL=1
MKDNDPRTTCTDIEGLLPLFVGGDLDGDDLARVAGHVAGCERCGAGLEAAREARHELRRGLRAGVQDREPELWPAIRAELAKEGLLGSPGVAAPGTVHPGDRADRRPRRLVSLPRVAAGIAAGFAVFLVGQGLLGPTDIPEGPTPGAGNELVEERGAPAPALGPLVDSALAGAEVDAPAAVPTGLRPVGIGNETLFDEAREDLLREAHEQRTLRSGAGFFPTDPHSGADAQGELASGFRLQ